MFNDLTDDARWTREFSELGAKAVRSALVSANWDKDKKVAARRWLERQDVANWQSGRTSADTEKVSIRERLRRSQKIWMILIGGGFLLFTAIRYLMR